MRPDQQKGNHAFNSNKRTFLLDHSSKQEKEDRNKTHFLKKFMTIIDSLHFITEGNTGLNH